MIHQSAIEEREDDERVPPPYPQGEKHCIHTWRECTRAGHVWRPWAQSRLSFRTRNWIWVAKITDPSHTRHRLIERTSAGGGGGGTLLGGKGRRGREPEFCQNYDGNKVQYPVSRYRGRPPAARHVARQGAAERRQGDQGQRHSAALFLFRGGKLSVCVSVRRGWLTHSEQRSLLFHLLFLKLTIDVTLSIILV